jgi:hypothetical protein
LTLLSFSIEVEFLKSQQYLAQMLAFLDLEKVIFTEKVQFSEYPGHTYRVKYI